MRCRAQQKDENLSSLTPTTYYLPPIFRLGLAGFLTVGRAITVTGCFAISSTGVLWAIASLENSAVAQVIPDTTLGAESSVVTPNANIRGLPTELIEGGAVRNANLFHSFSEFNVTDGQRVYFANPAGIENILSRVTGNNLSNILGTLGVDGEANLFLLNPNGIIFGENAQLDIAGSFVASTANSLVFENGFEFSATNPEAPPLLTINITPGLQYGSNHSGVIANAGKLAVGQDLTLAATNLNLQGQLHAGRDLRLEALDTAQVRDSAASPFIASAGGKLVIQGSQEVDIFALNHPKSGFFSGGDMVLRSPNPVIGDAHYTAGSNFQIEQPDGTPGNLHSPVDPVIRASGNVSFNNYTGGSLHIFAGGSVNISGLVTINGTDPTNFINEFVPLSQTLPDGTNGVPINGSAQPTLDIRAGTTAVGTPLGCTGCPLGQPTGLNLPNTPPTAADITINNITITQPDGIVFLTNQYQPNTALGGNIQVTTIRVDDNAGGFFGGFAGDGGDVFIDSRGNITIPGSALIDTSSSTGNAGNVTLIANGLTSLGNGVRINSSTDGTGRGGDINVQAESFSMTGNAQIGAFTAGQGDAGSVNINVRNAVSFSNSDIFTNVESGAVGNGGDINIQAESVSITDGSELLSFIRQGGQGNAGNVTINARDRVTMTQADYGGQPTLIDSTVSSRAVGNAGNINVRAGSVLIDGTAALQAYTYGLGNAGKIIVQVDDFLSLTNGGLISSEVGPGGAGNGGTIEIKASGSVNFSGFNPEQGYSSGLFANTGRGASGSAGSISVNTGALRVADGGVINVSTFNSSTGGSVLIDANSLEILGGGQVLALTRSDGNAGNVDIDVVNTVTISGTDATFSSRANQFGPDVVTNEGAASGIFSDASSFSTGDAGNITIDTEQLNVSDQGQILTASGGAGDAGYLEITATDSMNVSNQGLVATSSLSEGDGGTLSITTGQLNVRDGGQVLTGSFGAGDAGELEITSDSMNVSTQGVVATSSLSEGDSGNLSITTGQLNVRDGGQVLTDSSGTGNAGKLEIIATDSMNVVNPNSQVTTSAFGSTGDSGNLSITTERLNVSNGGLVATNSFTTGNAGELTVIATDSMNVSSQGLVSTGSTSSGNGGYLSVNTRQLDVTEEGQIATASTGTGNAGNLKLTVTDSMNVSTQGLVTTGSTGSGNSGSLSLITRQLNVSDEGKVLTVSAGTGVAGDLLITATDSINLVNQSFLATSPLDRGTAGNVVLETDNLSIRDRSAISTSTLGDIDAGDLTVRAADSVEVVNGSRLSADTFGSGNGGDLIIETEKLSVQNAGEVSAGAFEESSGQGGILSVTASDSVELSGGSLATLTLGSGRAGDLTVTTRRLTAGDGGRVDAGTAGLGQGGTVTVNASESIELSGTSVSGITPSGVSAFSSGSGNAASGDVKLTTGELIVRDGAEVTVRGESSGPAGNLEVTADSIFLENQGKLTASTASGEGGNISLEVQDSILMRSNSEISAQARGTGNGGNITMNVGNFIIAILSENSDIVANAFEGSGGRIEATAQRIFGFRQFLKRRTPESDFTASSEFGIDGVEEINTPFVDPSQGVTELPRDLVDPSSLVDRSCRPGAGSALNSSFTVTGRGGLPTNPGDALGEEGLLEDLGTPVAVRDEEQGGKSTALASPSSPPAQIVEAQGWVKTPDGTVILTAQAPNVTPQSPQFSSPSCQDVQAIADE